MTFHDTIYHLAHELSEFLHQGVEFSTFSNQTIRVTSHFQTPFKDTLFSVSLSHYLGPRPPMHPDSVPDLGAIQIIYLLTYLTKVNESRNMISQWKQRQIGHALKHDRFLQEILEE